MIARIFPCTGAADRRRGGAPLWAVGGVIWLSLLAIVPAWASGGESRFTPLSLEPDACPVVDQSAEEGWSVNRCPGVGGYQLEVEYSDDRMSATVVSPDGARHPLRFWELIDRSFSSIGDQAEWRVETTDGALRPYAVIIRFNAEKEAGIASWFAVSRVDRSGACLTAHIPAAEDGAEARARSAAEQAATQPCIVPLEEEVARQLESAKAGDAHAQREIGLRYQLGNGVPLDLEQAVHWYRKSAAQGYDVAQNDLGYLYGKGIGVTRDLELARVWYSKAAAQGNRSAESNLRLLDRGEKAAAIRCPDTITSRQIWGDPMRSPGWQGRDNGAPNTLLRGTLYRDHPEAGHALARSHYREDAAKEESYARWYFPHAERGTFWLGCSYDNTRIELYRFLPAEITFCKATYSTRLELKGEPLLLSLSCGG